MNLVVGCPVSHRTWILPAWFDAVRKSCALAELTPSFIFVADPRDASSDLIAELAPDAVILPVVDARGADVREWKPERYHRMVELRNLLLAGVQALAPEAFLSLDSDILLHPDAIGSLLDGLGSYDAVGARCYMTETGVSVPSWGRIGREGQLYRVDAAGLIAVEVIMAAKLMSPAAYRVPYRFHLQGEDIGWSLACRAAGLRLGWDGRVINKHVLHPRMLEPVDPRVGF